MTDDTSDNMPEDTPKADLSRQDCEQYMHILAPYQEKVFRQEGILSKDDSSALDTLKEKLFQIYSPDSLEDSKIYGHIDSIKSLSETRSAALRRREYDLEFSRLEKRLDEGNIPPDEIESISERLESIRGILEPEHYFG
jgi:hypothetical protein